MYELFAFTGAFGSLFIALIHALRMREPWHLITFALFLVMAYLSLYAASFVTQKIYQYPSFLFSDIPLIFLVAPLYYFFATGLKDQKQFWHRYSWLHLLPFVIGLIACWPYLMLSNEAQLTFLHEHFASLAIYPTEENNLLGLGPYLPNNWPSLKLIDFAAAIVVLVYIGASLITVARTINRITIFTDPNFYITIWISIGTLNCLLQIYVLLQNKLEYLVQAVTLTSLGFIFLYLIGQLFPNFARRAQEAKLYSHLQNVDVAQLKEKLIELMAEHRVFENPELSLANLANEMKISTHQLSALINSQFGQNFNTFLNSFRIAEAKKLMQEDGEKPILNIALEVGFNSYTSFFNGFRKETGLSPKKFRKKVA